MTTPISAVGSNDPYAAGAAATSSTTAPKDATADKMGSDAFLQLLVTQLKYQDPTNPADSTQFLAQTAQFQMVEKLEQLSKMTTEMNRIQHTVEANGLIGRQISYNLDGTEQTGVVSSARLTVDGATVRVGNKDVALDAVTEISAPSVPASPAT